jgi:hypothetical protein
MRLLVFPDEPSHADPGSAFLLAGSAFPLVGTIYAVSHGEWLRQASLVLATSTNEIRKFVLKHLDEEAQL